MTNCTITGNSPTGYGGGLYSFNEVPSPSTPTIANTIIAGNSVNGGNLAFGPDVSGSVNSLGFNLIGQTDGSTGWASADLTGTSASPLAAKLGPLANNGGPTLTELPQSGSPANPRANALVPAGITTDQRGRPRIDHGTVDIGAVEV